jgi:DNA-binding response OmpR family regulator
MIDGPSHSYHILVVEDDGDQAEALRAILEADGHSVTIASDGGQATFAFSRKRPDFVLLDLILPGEHGFELLERLKQQASDIPMFVISAIEMRDARSLARRVGATAYFTKPYDPDELLTRIQRVGDQTRTRKIEGASDTHKPIRFTCPCGKRYKVSPVHKGRSMTCSRCGTAMTVPFHD